MIYQAASLFGAILILAAYGLNQAGRLGPGDRLYLVMNLVGSAVLAWVAVVDRRAGFVLLEGAWAVLSLIPLVKGRSSAS